ncbi:MAG: LOG family protein [Ignavibacteria bacterium]|nr:LOG family protein [Ignavibacteria bacterium]
MNKTITSFGTAFIDPVEPLYSEIVEIGKYIAQAGYNTYCGGYSGSMEAISKGAISAGGYTVGIGVKGNSSKPNEYLKEFIPAENLMERIMMLITKADAYVIFRGGTGTLLEISAALELMNKNAMREKKMVFYSDFWKNIIETLKQDSERLQSLIERNVIFISAPGELSKYI